LGAGSEGFGFRLRTCRFAAGLSQHGLAQRSGLSLRMISDLERGRTRWPYRDSVSRLADALELDGQPRAEFIAAAGRRRAVRPAQPDVPRQLPPAVPEFAGRLDQLAVLSQVLEQPGGTATISAIGGMAGVGKTALAVQWAHQVAADFPDGQLYVNLRGFDPSGTPVTVAEAVRGLLDALGVPADRLPGTEQAQLDLYRSLLAGKRVLVVLDNARDVAQVRPLLPGSPTCRVVVTSRNQLAGLAAIEAARPLVLDVLTGSDARRLLAARLGEGRLAADPDAVEQIISACAHLPLALSVIAARAAIRPRLPLRQVADDLAGRRNLGAFASHDDPAGGVRGAFSWSYRQLDPATARVFRFASLHPGPDFWPPAIAALTGLSASDAARKLDALARVCMIHSTGPDRYGLHELLGGYAAELAGARDSADDKRTALTRVLDYYLGVAARHRRPKVSWPAGQDPPGQDPADVDPADQDPAEDTAFADAGAAMSWLGSQRANLVAAAVYAAGHGWPLHAIRLAEVLSRYLDVDAQFADAIALHDSAGQAARGLGDRVAEATALLNAGNVYLHQGHYQQGTDSIRPALALYQAAGNVTGQARALAALGLGSLFLGRPERAVDCFSQSLALHRQHGDLIGEARALGNLGFAALRQGRYADAAGYLRESLAVCRDAGDLRGQARARANLGEIELRQDRYAEAAGYLREALDGFRQVGDRVSAADTLASLGITEARQGRPAQAIDHLTQALEFCRQAGDVPRQALALNGLGEVLLATARPAQARKHYAAALRLAAQSGEKYEQARAHDGLATSYQASGARSQARRHWAEALATYSELGAPEAETVRGKLSQ
jgi:tetratricopeptide (TPR) repeat protein/transcriptional regulator with XRE-family HTH domain